MKRTQKGTEIIEMPASKMNQLRIGDILQAEFIRVADVHVKEPDGNVTTLVDESLYLVERYYPEK